MDKLSERLEAHADMIRGKGVTPLGELLREAAKLARRVEEAPMHSVSAMPGTNRGYGVIAVPGDLVDQRVRLVREE